MNDGGISPPRERDQWIMQQFQNIGYGPLELPRLNRVRCHQQVLFLSDVIGASGSGLDERYLRRRRRDEIWSALDFPKEKPSSSDFRLWCQALRQLVPPAGLPVRLGRFLHQGYKVWEWRVCRTEQYLLHYHGAAMDVYVPTSATARRW